MKIDLLYLRFEEKTTKATKCYLQQTIVTNSLTETA